MNGFEQYEVSNYSKYNKSCLHNLIYWNFNDYIGIGVSAHSFYKNVRFENTKNISTYIEMLKKITNLFMKMFIIIRLLIILKNT